MQKPLRIFIAALSLLFVLAGLWAGTAKAQAPTPSDDQVNAIARQLYCPVCENTPLDVCPTEACRQWRELIRQQLSEGWTEAQIKQYFVANYGARAGRAAAQWLELADLHPAARFHFAGRLPSVPRVQELDQTVED